VEQKLSKIKSAVPICAFIFQLAKIFFSASVFFLRNLRFRRDHQSSSNMGILDLPQYFYRDRDRNEIHILIEYGGMSYPIEIKKTQNLKSLALPSSVCLAKSRTSNEDRAMRFACTTIPLHCKATTKQYRSSCLNRSRLGICIILVNVMSSLFPIVPLV